MINHIEGTTNRVFFVLSFSFIHKLVIVLPVPHAEIYFPLFENLKLDNFSVLPGSESKLLKGLQLGCSGIITATWKVYDDFQLGAEQTVNQKLCDVRAVFEKYNLISGLHSYYSKNDSYYKNVLPPLSILNSQEEKELINNLEKLNFSIKSLKAA